ncbi:RodZ domain-containing protein [Arsukibacterium sp.]|uniref:RodZ domain-containing protein n=1 Tax=Arsukibacterium sp. TaxID=1977258 RepID=UPI002FDB4877
MSEPEYTVLTAGQLLRQAREQRQLSLEQVALQLNLRVSVLQQIEQDQPDAATLPTFTRGYVKAYARLLKLSEREVIQALEQTNAVPAVKAKPMQTFSNRTANQVTENRFMWLTYAIIGLLILSLLVWGWQSMQQGSLEQAAIEQDQVQQQAMPPQVQQRQTLVESDQTLTTHSVQQFTEVSEVATETEQLTESLEVAISSVAGDWQQAEQFSSQDQLAVDRLLMRFNDNCWIDVVDATGNRVAYGTKQAGYVMELTGQAPFLITLGNPSVVSIELNRQPFDMSALPGGRVARFSLPGQE